MKRGQCAGRKSSLPAVPPHTHTHIFINLAPVHNWLQLWPELLRQPSITRPGTRCPAHGRPQARGLSHQPLLIKALDPPLVDGGSCPPQLGFPQVPLLGTLGGRWPAVAERVPASPGTLPQPSSPPTQSCGVLRAECRTAASPQIPSSRLEIERPLLTSLREMHHLPLGETRQRSRSKRGSCSAN